MAGPCVSTGPARPSSPPPAGSGVRLHSCPGAQYVLKGLYLSSALLPAPSSPERAKPPVSGGPRDRWGWAPKRPISTHSVPGVPTACRPHLLHLPSLSSAPPLGLCTCWPHCWRAPSPGPPRLVQLSLPEIDPGGTRREQLHSGGHRDDGWLQWGGGVPSKADRPVTPCPGLPPAGPPVPLGLGEPKVISWGGGRSSPRAPRIAADGAARASGRRCGACPGQPWEAAARGPLRPPNPRAQTEPRGLEPRL